MSEIDPRDLPAPSDAHPGPWSETDHGNGHSTIRDANGATVAAVYCHGRADGDALRAALALANYDHPENPATCAVCGRVLTRTRVDPVTICYGCERLARAAIGFFTWIGYVTGAAWP